mgnify:CR=1 FL=1
MAKVARKKFNGKRLFDEIAQSAAVKVRWRASSVCGSREIRRTMALKRRRSLPNYARWGVIVPHYWAIFHHDGRGPVKARKGKVLAFFKDPSKDPRHYGRYPQRLNQVKHLTKEQFRRYKAQMIITRSVARTTGKAFFSSNHGLRGIPEQIYADSAEILSEQVRDFLGPLMRMEETLTVGFGLKRK